MNESDSQKQLELATSTIPPRDLDEEILALREGWNVLSSALEKNAHSFDEATLLAKVQPATSRPKTGRVVIISILGGALAASLLLLVAITAGRFVRQPIAQPQLMETSGKSRAAVEVSPSLTWDDPLDSQISVAAARMQSLQDSALPLDASISTLNYQLQQMAQDLNDGAL